MPTFIITGIFQVDIFHDYDLILNSYILCHFIPDYMIMFYFNSCCKDKIISYSIMDTVGIHVPIR
jgi:hypothetical protein